MSPNETISRDPAAKEQPKEPPVQAVPKPPADPGLTALVMMLQFLGVPAEPEQLRHQLGVTVIGTTEMLRCTRQFNIKARVVKTSWDRLDKTPLPAIVPLRDGGFLILGKAGDGKAIVQYPGSPRPQMLTKAQFEVLWDGRIVLMTKRAGLADLSRRFDITWFMGAVNRYRG